MLKNLDLNLLHSTSTCSLHREAVVEIVHTYQCVECLPGESPSWFGFLEIMVDDVGIEPSELLDEAEAYELSDLVQFDSDPNQPEKAYLSNPRVTELVTKIVDNYLDGRSQADLSIKARQGD